MLISRIHQDFSNKFDHHVNNRDNYFPNHQSKVVFDMFIRPPKSLFEVLGLYCLISYYIQRP